MSSAFIGVSRQEHSPEFSFKSGGRVHSYVDFIVHSCGMQSRRLRPIATGSHGYLLSLGIQDETKSGGIPLLAELMRGGECSLEVRFIFILNSTSPGELTLRDLSSIQRGTIRLLS